jgi:hypothetical protein
MSEKLLEKMVEIAKEFNLDVEVTGNDWAFDTIAEKVIIPTYFTVEDDTDKIWQKLVLAPILEDYSGIDFSGVPQFVYNFYHEIGHFIDPPQYEETALRKILDGLAQINKEVALQGYFELPSEQDATLWAIDFIYLLILNKETWW